MSDIKRSHNRREYSCIKDGQSLKHILPTVLSREVTLHPSQSNKRRDTTVYNRNRILYTRVTSQII